VAADGEVNIDVVLNTQQPDQKVPEFNEKLKDLGKGAGDKAEESIKKNTEKSSEHIGKLIKRYNDVPKEIRTKLIAEGHKEGIKNFGQLLQMMPKKQLTKLVAKAEKGEAIDYDKLLRSLPHELVTKVHLDENASLSLKKLRQELIKAKHDTKQANDAAEQLGNTYKSIPKTLRTELIADARDHGISNMDRLLRKMPKETRTELIAKAKKGEAIDYEKLLQKIPAKLITEVRLNNKASLPMREIQQQANATGRSFSHLKEIMLGTFAGQWLMTGLGALKNGLLGAARAGMQYNIAQDRMKTVWTALTTEAPRDGQRLIKFINDVSQHSIYAADTVDRMAQSFYHVHSSVKETKQWTTDFVRLGSTLHMNNDQLAEAGEQFAKIVAGGKANAEDMSVMINRFPMFGEALQKATGKSMKQLYDLSAKGKLTAQDFTQALDYLGKKYKNSTAEAMTSFTGMSMYIRSRWSVLWGDVMNTSFKANKQMSTDLRNLLSDQMVHRYADMMGVVMGRMLHGLMSVLEYLGSHKTTVIDFLGNLGKIIEIIGQSVWETFAGVLRVIAESFGLVFDHGKKSADALSMINGILAATVKHKTGLQAIVHTLAMLWAVNKIKDFVSWVQQAAMAMNVFGASSARAQAATQSAMGQPVVAGAERSAAQEAAAPQYLDNGALLSFRSNGTTGSLRSRLASSGLAVRGANFLSNAGAKMASADYRMPALIGVGGAATEVMSRNNTGMKVGGSIGSIGGSIAGAALGSLAGPEGTLVGSMAGEFLGKKIGEATGKWANKQMAGHSIVAHTKIKIDGDSKGTSKALIPGLNKVASTVLKMNVDPNSIARTKAKTNKMYDDLEKRLDKYYRNKESKSKKDLDLLVKNGQMSQSEENKRLAAQRKADDQRERQHKKSLEKMRKDTNDHYSRLQKIQDGATKKMQAAAQKYGTNSKKYQQVRQKELEKENQRFAKQLVKDQTQNDKAIQASVKKGASQQEKIYKDLRRKRGQLSLQDLKQTQRDANKQYEASVRPAKKARDEIIKAAQQRYRKTKAAAEKEYKENHTISRKKYREIVANAKKQRDDTTKAADDEYRKNTKSARKQHKEVSKEINDQKTDVINAANGQSAAHTTAADEEMSGVNGKYSGGFGYAGHIWNSFLNGVKSVLRFFKASTKGIGSVPEKYAIGTGALSQAQVALVGEEGFELGYNPQQGYHVLGSNGPELRYLPQGESILTHAQSKSLMSMFGGRVPGYAHGTGTKIADFLKDGIDEAFDLVDKGASAIWNWLKEKTGLDRLLASQASMGGVKRTTHGTFEIAKDAIGNFIKKAADKFMESFGGAVTGDHKKLMHAAGIPASWFSAIDYIVTHESGWRVNATNPSSGAYGLPQSLPGSKMASAGHDWRTNPVTQLKWMKGYVSSRYGGGPGAAAFWRAHHWYANGGWADAPAIFGEVKGEPELAVNPARDSAEEHIAEAIEARAQINPNGFAGSLNKLINSAKNGQVGLVPTISDSHGNRQAIVSGGQQGTDLSGDMNISVQLDSSTIAQATYPKIKAMKVHEVIVHGIGGAVPVGRAMPTGGGF
jgi:tape measure domain-containing protein